jgi:hypothetical protein
LEVAYVSLSNFQPLTTEERDAVLIMEGLDDASAVAALLTRCHADGAALLDELRSLSKPR